MAVPITRKTAADSRIRIVTVVDDAIDWEKSYPEIVDIAEKKDLYIFEHDLEKIVFLEDKKPTVFYFKDPRRVDVNKTFRKRITQMQGLTKGASDDVDLLEDTYNICLVGYAEGLDSEPVDVPRTGGGKVSADFLQGLMDSSIFQELANTVIALMNKPVDSIEKK
jgi:hypothetical protein